MKNSIKIFLILAMLYNITTVAQTKISLTGIIKAETGLQTNGLVHIVTLNNKKTTIGKINADGTFLVDSTNTGRFYIYAIPDPKSGSVYLPTYYLQYLSLNEATIISSFGNVSGIEINLIKRTVSENGIALLEGRFSYADNNTDDNTELSRNWLNNAYTPTKAINISQPPCKNMSVLLYNSADQVVAYAVTDLQGYYSFKNLTGGNYRIEGQRYSYTTEFGGYLNVSVSGTTQTSLRMVNQAVTGISEMEYKQEQVIFYPNPFQSRLNLGQYSGKMTVTNLMGTVFFEKDSFEVGEISTENWPKGVYIINHEGNTDKILKN